MIGILDTNFGLHATKVMELNTHMRVYQSANLSYTDSGLLSDTHNIIHVTNGVGLNAAELQSAIDHFRDQSSQYCIWINDVNLQAAEGIFASFSTKLQDEGVGMVLDLSSYSPVALSDNIKIVGTERDLQDYAQVIAENWSPPNRNIFSYYELTLGQYLDPTREKILFVYYFGQIPVATIELFPSDDEVIGLYGLATRMKYRGKGIGSLMLKHALNYAKGREFRHVVLQASSDGLGIYRKFGFKEVTSYYIYV